MGMPVDVTIRLASSGIAILHEATGDGKRPPNHEISMFYVEGDRLFGIHFCDGANRVRWEGKMSSDGNDNRVQFPRCRRRHARRIGEGYGLHPN